MATEEEFDLSKYLGDSLSLQNNYLAPVRYSRTPDADDYYRKFTLKDPYELLGERDFKKEKETAETITGTPIQEFYRGANVFITGATGFVGKILTEKLIRCVPEIGHLYLLIRGKKGKTSQERFDELLQDKVFRRMREEVPDWAARVTPVDGDIGRPGLGLRPADRRALAAAHVVVHSAADVRFIEPLRTAVANNVLGSRHVLELAREMPNLRSFIHISTAYSQCVRRVVEENVPKLPIPYQEILKYIESRTDEELKEETPRLLQGWPNTYTFSKAICEEMIIEEAKDLPVAVFRPSVVVPTYREPVRGWTDNLYGPMGLLVGTGHGVLHCFRMAEEYTIDTVPVDYVVNCLIAAAWRIADERYRSKDAPTVYNFTFTSVRPGIPWKEAVAFSLSLKDNWPFSRSIWYTSYFYVENWYVNEFFWYLLHKIPGRCFDKLAELTGGTPALQKIYQRIENLKEQTDYFSFNQWNFKNDNVLDLWKSLSEDDKKIFYFDVRDIDIKEQFVVSKLGIKYYYLKEEIESIPAAQRKNTWLYWLHNSVKLTCSLVALKLLVVTANALPF